MKFPACLCSILLIIFSCNKSDIPIEELPVNYTEMFKKLNLEPGISYKYTEIINNTPTGKEGLILFSLSDTTMLESFNNHTIIEHFRLDSLQQYTCRFENMGYNKYNPVQSTFINNAQQKISYINGKTIVSFSLIENGSFYFLPIPHF
jgi:hypothetical protein